MATIIPIATINQFLPNEKLELDESISGSTGDPIGYELVRELAETARDIVKGKMSGRYNTGTWFAGDTPSLMMNIAAMFVAGWVYDRQFAEEATEGSSYGIRLVERAYRLLDEALGGGLVVAGALFATEAVTQSATYEETEPTFVVAERY
jgi:hypothetical protein